MPTKWEKGKTRPCKHCGGEHLDADCPKAKEGDGAGRGALGSGHDERSIFDGTSSVTLPLEAILGAPADLAAALSSTQDGRSLLTRSPANEERKLYVVHAPDDADASGMVRGCAGSPSELTLVTLCSHLKGMCSPGQHTKPHAGYLLMHSDFVLGPLSLRDLAVGNSV